MKTQQARGFTLIEVQIGLLLLVLIIGLVYSALHLATRSSAKSEQAIELTEHRRLISRFMQKQIAQIHPLYWSDRRGSSPIFFGEPDSVVFTGPLVASGEPDRIYLQSLAMEKANDHNTLNFLHAPLDLTRDPKNQQADLNAMPILEEIDKLSFSYYGTPDNRNNQNDWHDRWESNKNLPLIIRAEIQQKDAPPWPMLFFPLRVTQVESLNQFKLRSDETANTRNRQQQRDEPVNDAD